MRKGVIRKQRENSVLVLVLIVVNSALKTTVVHSFKNHLSLSYRLALTLKARFIHGSHTRAVMLPCKSVDVNFHWNRPHRGTKIKQTHLNKSTL